MLFLKHGLSPTYIVTLTIAGASYGSISRCACLWNDCTPTAVVVHPGTLCFIFVRFLLFVGVEISQGFSTFDI